MVDRLTELSKLVSYALRHRPWEFELELDADGWVPLDQLVDALRAERGWESLTAADVEAMLAAATRRRHELRDGRIRAQYGHTVPGRIEHETEPDPGRLFHGTARGALDAIDREGLLPRRRQYVHLARRPQLAVQIGRRHDSAPVLLEVDAAAAAAAGVRFFRAGEEIVLAEHVPAQYVAMRSYAPG